MNYEELKTKIESALGGDIKLKIVRQSLLVEDPLNIIKVASFLKDSSELRMDYLSGLRASDFIEFFEVVYHLYSTEKKIGPLQLRVRVKRETPNVPSLVSIYRGAEYQERVAYDMYGIHFEGHPDPRRIYMWDSFEAFPMRKDYVQEDSDILEAEDIEWLDKKNISVSAEVRKRAEEMAAQGIKAVAQQPTDIVK